MRYTTFGRTGLTVSTLGLGGASIGGAYGPVVDEQEALRTVQAAVNLDITFIDTAPLYGMGLSEERIGLALAECRGRDKVILATKVGYLPSGLGYDRATTVAAVEASLVRLRTDTVDLSSSTRRTGCRWLRRSKRRSRGSGSSGPRARCVSSASQATMSPTWPSQRTPGCSIPCKHSGIIRSRIALQLSAAAHRRPPHHGGDQRQPAWHGPAHGR